MNVLFVYLGFLPANHWGGPVKIIYHNAKELQRRGYKITVCASNLLDKHSRTAPGCSKATIDGLPVVYLNTIIFPRWPGTLGPSLLSPRAVQWLKREISRSDLIHVNGTRNAISMAALFFAQRQRKPIVLQPHGTLAHIVSSIRLKRGFDRIILKRLVGGVNKFIAGQQAEVQQIIAAGVDPDRIRIIPNGIRSTIPANGQGATFRTTFGLAQDEKIILFLARINRKKGADLLVKAYAQLPAATRASSRLIIAGPDDGQLAEVKKLVTLNKLEDRVVFTGILQSDDVAGAFAVADIFVLPCRVDTFPMAILEACQAGTPMVVTETCEISDILNGRAATVVPVDPDAIANGMEQLLSDATLQERYRRGIKELLQTVFSIESVGDKLETVYIEAIQVKGA